MAVLAAAYDVVLVETTGVGQTETDIEFVADTVCLVVQPGSGDMLLNGSTAIDGMVFAA